MGLQDEVFYLGERSDSSVLGVWCEPNVEAILLNSAYGFGIGFAPYGGSKREKAALDTDEADPTLQDRSVDASE